VASASEKFLYAVMVGPMVLIVIHLHYAETKRKVLGEADPQIRQVRLEELQNRFRTLFLVVILASILSAASAGWFLFGLAPETR